MPDRRRWMVGTLGAAALGAIALARPGDRGRGHDAYFARLQAALREAGVAQPTVVVDRARLRRNLARIGARAKANGLPLRVVVKSLPCPALIDAAMQAWQSSRAMLFNAPQLVALAQAQPDATLLLGKPLPAAAAAALVAGPLRQELGRIEWLVDTPQRLQQYREIARSTGATLALNLEIDVGLHRGGVESPDVLGEMLAAIRAEPRLRWSGLMGYDAHVVAVPDVAGNRARAAAAMHERYAAMWRAATAVFTQADRRALTLNTGGSPTFHLHDRDGLPNEVAVGSAALKPADFDLPSLADLEPAVFIATPLLKDLGAFRLPEGAGLVSTLAAAWDPNQRRAFAIHGGHWAADVVSPAGLAPSGLFGASANQQVVVGSPGVALAPDDIVFFRPRHSEALLLQFGGLVLVEDGHVVATLPVYPASA